MTLDKISRRVLFSNKETEFFIFILTTEKSDRKSEMEKKQHYRIVVSERGWQRLSTILDACGENSLEFTESKSYIVITTKTIAEKLKTDNDWVEKVELFSVYNVMAVVDE